MTTLRKATEQSIGAVREADCMFDDHLLTTIDSLLDVIDMYEAEHEQVVNWASWPKHQFPLLRQACDKTETVKAALIAKLEGKDA